MLKPLLARSGGDRLVGPTPGRIDPRSLWTRLSASHAVAPDDRPAGHALDILTATRTGTPGLLADHGHAWIRLVEPDGRYCSVGFFPDESTGIEPDERPGLRMPGMLLSPDKYDRVGWNERSTRIHLDETEWRGLVVWIERLQAERMAGSLAFDLVDRSCVGFVVRAAARVGVTVEASVPPSRFVADAVLRRTRDAAAARGAPALPRAVRQAVYNLVLAALGGRATVNRQWLVRPDGGPELCRVHGLAPLFGGWHDVLRRPVPFYHVRPLRDWQQRVLDSGVRLGGSAPPAPEQACDAQPPHRADADAAGAGRHLDQGLVADQQAGERAGVEGGGDQAESADRPRQPAAP